jgi:hypothetical protein
VPYEAVDASAILHIIRTRNLGAAKSVVCVKGSGTVLLAHLSRTSRVTCFSRASRRKKPAMT